MTLFDFVASLILCVSALVGLARGAVRELVSFFAFTLAALSAVFLLPFSSSEARRLVHPPWAAGIVAGAVIFLVVYIALRVAGASLSSRLRSQGTLGALDRGAGLGLGVARGLLTLGVFYLVFSAVTPAWLIPDWISHAKLYDVSRSSGRVIASLTPPGLKQMGGVGRILQDRGVVGSEPESGSGGASDAVPESAPPPAPPAHHHRRHAAREAE